MNKIVTNFNRVLSNPRIILKYFLHKTSGLFTNEELYVRLNFRLNMKKKLNLDDPQTFNEKLQWLKLYNRDPEYVKMVDKADAKKYVKSLIGDDYIIPTFGVWDNVEDIDFSKLPDKFVLKCTHDSGGIIICKDKSSLNIKKAKNKLKKGLKTNFYNIKREWPYKNVKPRIIGEKFLIDESGYELKDYKFFCFNGEPKFLFIATDRPKDTKFDFFDLNFNHLPIINGHPNSTKVINKPKNFEKMIEIAIHLSKNIPHVRVDLYNINGKIYFGELTFFHWGGTVPFYPEEWDYTFGQYIKLPKINK